MKLISVVGARLQFVKVAPILRATEGYNVTTAIVHLSELPGAEAKDG